MDDSVVIRSYKRVFKLDRRLHRIDKWALPVPGGVPLNGITYFAVALGVMVFLRVFPLTGWLVELLPPALKFVIFPLAISVALTQTTLDGRGTLPFALSWIRIKTKRHKRRTCAFDRKVKVGWDIDAPDLHKLQVRGPATVVVRKSTTLNDRWNGWWAEGGSGEPRVVQVDPGQTLKVRP